MPIQQYSPPTTCVHPQQQSPVVMNASCFPIKGKKFNERSVALPSSEIKKENLLSSDIVIKKYPKLRHSFGQLAVKLAKESFFGEDVLIRCTVMGCRTFPSLPLQELNQLKQTIFSLYSMFWSNPSEFESKVWSQCVNSVDQLCKRLRNDQQKSITTNKNLPATIIMYHLLYTCTTIISIPNFFDDNHFQH